MGNTNKTPTLKNEVIGTMAVGAAPSCPRSGDNILLGLPARVIFVPEPGSNETGHLLRFEDGKTRRVNLQDYPFIYLLEEGTEEEDAEKETEEDGGGVDTEVVPRGKRPTDDGADNGGERAKRHKTLKDGGTESSPIDLMGSLSGEEEHDDNDREGGNKVSEKDVGEGGSAKPGVSLEGGSVETGVSGTKNTEPPASSGVSNVGLDNKAGDASGKGAGGGRPKKECGSESTEQGEASEVVAPISGVGIKRRRVVLTVGSSKGDEEAGKK